jgi:hypothetical protein
MFKAESDLLELMKDMVNVTSNNKALLANDNTSELYASLGCDITHVPKTSAEYKSVAKTGLNTH